MTSMALERSFADRDASGRVRGDCWPTKGTLVAAVEAPSFAAPSAIPVGHRHDPCPQTLCLPRNAYCHPSLPVINHMGRRRCSGYSSHEPSRKLCFLFSKKTMRYLMGRGRDASLPSVLFPWYANCTSILGKTPDAIQDTRPRMLS